MAKTKIAVLWGVLIAMMVACAGIYATLKAREMNPYIGGTSTRIESVQTDAGRFGIFEQTAYLPHVQLGENEKLHSKFGSYMISLYYID